MKEEKKEQREYENELSFLILNLDEDNCKLIKLLFLQLIKCSEILSIRPAEQ
jgi:hypothetical protein